MAESIRAGHDDSRRHIVHASICAESWEAWEEYCRTIGVSITAAIDALGHEMRALLDSGAPYEGLGDPGRNAIAGAREIDANRRRRAHSSKLEPTF